MAFGKLGTFGGRGKRKGITSAMAGVNPAFSPPVNSLPANYNFDDLAQYEEGRRNDFSKTIQDQLAERRGQYSTALNTQGNELFKTANPAILEDLNARGLLNSDTARSTAQANALRDIGQSNQQHLNEFDNQATAAGLQSQQDALDSALDLRRGQLESNMQQAQSAQEMALAERLAAQQSKTGITQSLIGGGGSILAGLLAGRGGGGGGLFGGGGGGGGGLGGLFGGGGAAAAGGYAPSAGAASSLFPGGVGAAGAGGAGAGGIGAAGGLGLLAGGALGASLLARAGEKKGGALGGLVANPIGYQINKAKEFVSNPVQTLSNAGSSISKSISKAFCFDEETPITMEDGTITPICELALGDKTKGGIVESVRISRTAPNTLYLYKDVKVTGSHAVKEPQEWLRVEDSSYAAPIKNDQTLPVWSIVTDKHRIFVNDIIFADEHESDLYESLNMDQSLDELNRHESPAESIKGAA